ncbi:MAG: large subunit ribosomal protein L29 [Planctomycetota bacterium]|jgi:large subunit ribosomal protein L29
MNIEETRSKTDDELAFDLKGMKKELFGLRLKAATEALANSAQIRVLRRSIARVNTVLHERATGIRGQESR